MGDERGDAGLRVPHCIKGKARIEARLEACGRSIGPAYKRAIVLDDDLLDAVRRADVDVNAVPRVEHMDLARQAQQRVVKQLEAAHLARLAQAPPAPEAVQVSVGFKLR